ncbi:hypothetical protein Plim_3033 [Planctopirus limnophila DSM 3776]|uniref:Carboxypeptidase regulatory-like domain-containing protein n=1 Tax=Planctopirus limnophila (strain ATCC 43296 / DSM 3776 / IFAM 1008 / Mu 290) TaxID=521674 RepID=D5SSQ4_PLAL2|nr:carboxypeptidase-like regulatory domain-containing protein [Planctopirus limnophila]ADG68855.1 hypothetical protein Plim_3033 [Planctopirus limnophila DSM 3776]
MRFHPYGLKTYRLLPHALPLWLFLWFASGCSQPVGTIEGSVTINGEPAKGMAVTFKSTDDNFEGFGMTDEQGRFRIFRGRGKQDFLPGNYKVAIGVMETEGDSNRGKKIPEEVSDINQTTLVKTVQAGRNDIKIDLNPVLRTP